MLITVEKKAVTGMCTNTRDAETPRIAKKSGIANTRPRLGESIQFHHVRGYVYIFAAISLL